MYLVWILAYANIKVNEKTNKIAKETLIKNNFELCSLLSDQDLKKLK